MPKQWITKFGVEQTRRAASALFPATFELQQSRFTLERDGMHVTVPMEDGQTTHLLFSRGEVASLIDWLTEQDTWFGSELDPAYEVEVAPQECGYCLRNLAHTREEHQQAIERAKEQRKHLAERLNERLFERA